MTRACAAVLIGFALVVAPHLARADRRPTSFLVASPLNAAAPCQSHPPRNAARGGANYALIVGGGVLFSVSYGLTAFVGAISVNPPTESSWVREDAWWLVPGVGGFIAGVHRRALGDYGGYTRMALGAAFGVLQSSGVYLMVEGIRRFGRPQAVSRAAWALPFVSVDLFSSGTSIGLAGSF